MRSKCRFKKIENLLFSPVLWGAVFAALINKFGDIVVALIGKH